MLSTASFLVLVIRWRQFWKKKRSYVYKGVLQVLNLTLGSVGGVSLVIKKISRITPGIIKNIVGKAAVKEIPAIYKDDSDCLYEVFYPKITELGEHLKRDLPIWKIELLREVL